MNRVVLVEKYLDELYKNPRCELNYTKDYELLIAVMLSAQTTDKKVNTVTKILFERYPTLEDLIRANINEIKKIIRPIGSYNKKALYIQGIARRLVEEFDGVVPNDKKILCSFPGVGRKTTNVVLSNLYNVPAIAVDTHVERVSKRLGLAKDTDDVLTIEKKLMRKYKKENWSKRHHQMVLFGRYHCKAIKPNCENCKLRDICKRKDIG